MVKRAFNKISNGDSYGRMPAAGVDTINANWLLMVARLERVKLCEYDGAGEG